MSVPGRIVPGMTSPPPPPTCCGHKGAGFPSAGEPIALPCQLCDLSPSYWRLPQNRADGKPYQPVRALGADDDGPA
jgi:hypothetical protein